MLATKPEDLSLIPMLEGENYLQAVLQPLQVQCSACKLQEIPVIKYKTAFELLLTLCCPANLDHLGLSSLTISAS